MMDKTPNANRLHIGFFGRCNAGKSTLINMLTGQDISLVSEVAGTTTDPVTKAMEILPLGPVVLIDTAGVDDTSELGKLRIEKTKSLLPKVNLAVYIVKSDEPMGEDDFHWLSLLKQYNIATLLVVNEIAGYDGNVYVSKQQKLTALDLPYICVDGQNTEFRKDVLSLLGTLKPKDEEEVSLLEGIINPGDVIILVCPIDSAAPKGRLILPQVQMIREILDRKGLAIVVQTEELLSSLKALQQPPRLVITDSQAFGEVSRILPEDVPLTSFSVLMARFKGRLRDLVAGVEALTRLDDGAKVLISEGCTHHRQCDDIGTVKIPRWLNKAGYHNLDLSWTSGGKFPDDITIYDLIVHCGSCMLTRREVLRRLDIATEHNVPIVNYGVLIAYLHGILERAIAPFKHELKQ